jgi:hypothetical protein
VTYRGGDYNLTEFRVRFYPNGTSDQCIIQLFSTDNERSEISLDVITALADLETDRSRFLRP